jgi:hypothetical protein
MGSNMQTSMAAGAASAPRNNMMAPNIFDPRTDGSDYYWYIANPTNAGVSPLASGATGNASIQIDAGTDFYWIATTIQADISGAVLTESTDVIPLVTVLINDTGTSRNLMNAPIPIGSLAGDGKRPYRIVRPRLFRANSIINLTFTNYAVAGTTYTNLYLTLHGYRRLVTPPNASNMAGS